MTKYRKATLDFTKVQQNSTVRNQGIQTCIFITAYGNGAWFSPELGRYPSRQDLAVVNELDDIEI
jgi:hypothetical protein